MRLSLSPLYHLDAETLLVATYVWVDDELKASQAQGLKLPRKQRHQKATLAELLALAIFLLRSWETEGFAGFRGSRRRPIGSGEEGWWEQGGEGGWGGCATG